MESTLPHKKGYLSTINKLILKLAKKFQAGQDLGRMYYKLIKNMGSEIRTILQGQKSLVHHSMLFGVDILVNTSVSLLLYVYIRFIIPSNSELLQGLNKIKMQNACLLHIKPSINVNLNNHNITRKYSEEISHFACKILCNVTFNINNKIIIALLLQ